MARSRKRQSASAQTASCKSHSNAINHCPLRFAGLVQDTQGNFYGTTSYDGDPNCDCGIVFEVSPGGTESVLHKFTGSPADGAHPYAGLVLDAQGNLYGNTQQGGAYSQGGISLGTVFKIVP